MTEAVRYSSLIQAKHEPGVASLIEQAAKARGMTVSEWSRQAHRTLLELQGFGPAQISASDPRTNPEPFQSQREAS